MKSTEQIARQELGKLIMNEKISVLTKSTESTVNQDKRLLTNLDAMYLYEKRKKNYKQCIVLGEAYFEFKEELRLNVSFIQVPVDKRDPKFGDVLWTTNYLLNKREQTKWFIYLHNGMADTQNNFSWEFITSATTLQKCVLKLGEEFGSKLTQHNMN